MIYTVTFNPSLDYIVEVANFQEGSVNRTEYESYLPGGKGLNVSIVLSNLGISNTALGFIAGFTGDEIERRVADFSVNTDFIRLPFGNSRINVKLKSKCESEINAKGPDISEEDLEILYRILGKLKDGDYLVLAGSVPKTLSDFVYRDIIRFVGKRNVKVIADATGKLLLNLLEAKPFLIKPNNYELEEIFGVKIEKEEDIIFYGRKLIEIGARNVLISRAEKGGILICEDGKVINMEPPKGKVLNSVGAGDSMVAGFIAGYIETQNFEYALKLGICSGSASAFSNNLATKKEIYSLLEKF